jgi:hypothetical protein
MEFFFSTLDGIPDSIKQLQFTFRYRCNKRYPAVTDYEEA